MPAPNPSDGSAPATKGFAGSILRAEDQLRLTYEVANGTVVNGRIVALEPEEPIYYSLSFGSQHLVEDTIPTGSEPPDGPRAHRRALPGRVSFEIPSGTRFTTTSLLDLARFPLHVDPRADGAEAGDPAPPTADVTALEIPASLILSPPSLGPRAGRFLTRTLPIVPDGVTELWRARLTADGRVGPFAISAQPALRAIARSEQPPEFPAYLADLDLLIEATTGPGSTPLDVHELTLSSQGATLDMSGAWSGDLAAYRHRTIGGRDLRVEQVIRGFLLPFGHEASLTTLVERDLLADRSQDLTASLTEDTYLAVTGSTVTFHPELTGLMPHDGRRLPFTTIEAVDRGTGRVEHEQIELDGPPIDPDLASLLRRDGRPVTIAYSATDRAGADGITFELPAVFVTADEAYAVEGDVLTRLQEWFASTAADAVRQVQLGGQPVGWADPSPRGGAGSTQTTNRIVLSLDRPAGADADEVEQQLRELGRPAFYPGVDEAWVVDTVAGTVTNGAVTESRATIAERWLEHGNGEGNLDLGYLDLDVDADEPHVITPSTDALGMIAASFNVDTFGQFLGGGVRFPGDGNWSWDLEAAFPEVPKLLGSIDIAELLPDIDLAELATPDGLPNLRIEPRFDDADLPDLPTGACLHLTWEPPLRSYPAGSEDQAFVVTADMDGAPLPDPDVVFDGRETRALLALTTCLPEATSTFEARLEHFALQMPPARPVVVIAFRNVSFVSGPGGRSIDVDVADWAFVNALSWLEPLKDLLVGLLDVGTSTFADDGIDVDYGLVLPSFSLGVVGVRGLRVDLGLDLPNDDPSEVSLDIGRRDDPFRITIFGFGGDGSFGLLVDAKQIVLIEGSLAVAWELGVDIFIASASVSVSLGVYVRYVVVDDPEVTLGAYASIRGSISALGLLEISGAVTVALEYRSTARKLRGVAAITGEVSSIFGKKEVTHDVEVEVDFGRGGGGQAAVESMARVAALGAGRPTRAPGSPQDLSFADHFSTEQWFEYCAAFAAV